MKTTIRLSGPLRASAEGKDSIRCEGETIGEALSALKQSHSRLHELIVDEQGNTRRFIKIFVNSQDIRSLEGLSTKISDNDEITVIQAVAGG